MEGLLSTGPTSSSFLLLMISFRLDLFNSLHIKLKYYSVCVRQGGGRKGEGCGRVKIRNARYP